MNYISFPNIGLEFNVNPVLFEIGNLKIYWYGFLIVLSFIVGLLLMKKNSKSFGIEYDDILELFIILLPIVIICARMYYIVFNLDYYLLNPEEIIKISSGGLAIYGGILGGIICLFVFSKIKNIKFLKLLDLIAISLPLGQAIGRWGNFLNVEAYGCITDTFFKMGIMEGENIIYVHPTFLYESVFCIIIFIVINLRKKNIKFDGELVCYYLASYGIVRALVESLRADSLMFYNIKVSLVLSIILFVVAMCYIVYKKICLNIGIKEIVKK